MVRKPQAEPVLLGPLEEQVMLAVLRIIMAVPGTGGDAYGMHVRHELETVTGRDFAIGAVYATLDRLEAKGLVASSRTAATTGAPSRRVFDVTPHGARSLEHTRAMRDWLWTGVKLATRS